VEGFDTPEKSLEDIFAATIKPIIESPYLFNSAQLLSKKNNTPLSIKPISGGDRHPFIGNSDAICRIREHLEGIGQADDNITVLITGETGVGKEVAARYLHRVSQRHAQPFCTVPLSSLPSTLI
jgi:Nif-specific regulatory protein